MNENLFDIRSDVEKNLALIPEKPGVYRFYDQNKTILYVGKAKNLRKRVSSYFQKEHTSARLKLLVKKIRFFDYIVVASEWEALLLENNLIKKLQPRYNVNLKDDKSYPWIVIVKENFPRIISTRQHQKFKGEKFGPFASVITMRSLMHLIREMFHLRTCKLDLSPEKIRENRYRPCLEYHIGKCKAPCAGKQSEQDYLEEIESAKQIIKGKIDPLKESLQKKMEELADKWEFEKAEEVKRQIQILDDYQHKSTVVSAHLGHLDVITYHRDQTHYFFNYLKVEDGRVVQSYNLHLEAITDEEPEDLIPQVLFECRQIFLSEAKEVIVPQEINWSPENTKITVPKGGEKSRLLELSYKNARQFYMDWLLRKTTSEKAKSIPEILIRLKEDLRINEVPTHIECFDNSNIQGTYAVSSCVVFKYGRPSKKDYRHFNVKTVEGPDDFSTMKEVVYRRYKRLLDENEPLPQLIVIDGGKGQLNAALEALNELQLRGKISIVSIAKRLEEIYFPGDPYPLYLDKKSPSLKLLQHIRNEAHRFAISHHRRKRDVKAIRTQLTKIPGVGEKTASKLIQTFGSIEQIKKSGFEELAKITGQKLAAVILQHLEQEQQR
ncbi:MAG: UvrABC system protein C [Vicingaceae bacterium]|nr:MAG: UvrABC system protein C [Vicingaceae bacterium]